MRIKNFDFDFIVYVAGNIGVISDRKPLRSRERKPTEIYILPKDFVHGKTNSHDLYKSPTKGGHDEYLAAWHLIDEFLSPVKQCVKIS